MAIINYLKLLNSIIPLRKYSKQHPIIWQKYLRLDANKP